MKREWHGFIHTKNLYTSDRVVIASTGLYAVDRPKHLQHFVAHHFSLSKIRVVSFHWSIQASRYFDPCSFWKCLEQIVSVNISISISGFHSAFFVPVLIKQHDKNLCSKRNKQDVKRARSSSDCSIY